MCFRLPTKQTKSGGYSHASADLLNTVSFPHSRGIKLQGSLCLQPVHEIGLCAQTTTKWYPATDLSAASSSCRLAYMLSRTSVVVC